MAMLPAFIISSMKESMPDSFSDKATVSFSTAATRPLAASTHSATIAADRSAAGRRSIADMAA